MALVTITHPKVSAKADGADTSKVRPSDWNAQHTVDETALVTALAAKSAIGHTHIIDNVTGLQAALDLKAPLASPALTGTPTAPTAAAGTSTTQIATTAFVTTGVRERLTANRTYYIRTDGSDSNNGLTNSAGGAFLTIQKAMNNLAANVDTAGFAVTFQCGDGTYAGGLAIVSWQGGGNITLQGNTGDKNAVVLSNNTAISVSASFIGAFIVQFVKFTGTSVPMGMVSGAGTIRYNNVNFAGVAVHHIQVAVAGGQILQNGPYEISAGATNHVNCLIGGTWSTTGAHTVTVSNTPNFTGAFVTAADGRAFTAALTYANASGKTRQATTGDTHTNTTLDNLGINTSTLSVGMAVTGINIPANTTIASILGANSVQLSNAATGTTVGGSAVFEIATGIRYNATLNAVINVNGGGANYFPGSIAGATGTGGQYA